MKQCRIEDCKSTDLATRSALCKEHHREYVREHYRSNTQSYLDKAKKHRTSNGELIRQAKSVPCFDCKQSYPYYVMDFDHKENKEFTLGLYRNMGKNQILTEIAKCDVVCSNCHRMRTAQRAGYGISMEQVVE